MYDAECSGAAPGFPKFIIIVRNLVNSVDLIKKVS